jgi:hypothetical protein
LGRFIGACNGVILLLERWNADADAEVTGRTTPPLLLDILSRRPQLVPVLFPEAYRSILPNQVAGRIELSFIGLKKAFTNLVDSVPEGLKICFLINGIDKYHGDHNEITELFHQATTSDSLKILLSSRPIPACIQAFSKCSKLRLQDLTHNDVRSYVEDELARNPLMLGLEEAEKGATSQLVNGITKKAAGVLLWVVLVVRSLLMGLQDYDTIQELPPTLEKLYAHMLGSMSSQNRRQGSKLLQLVLRSTDTHGDYPMTILQLSFAEDENYSQSLSVPISTISTKEEEWRCEATEGRMRSRCCGLIEVQDPPASRKIENGRKSDGFLHRTVVEFLQTDKVWDQIVSLTFGTRFDVDQAILSSSLWEMKVKAYVSSQDEEFSSAVESMLRILTYQQQMENIQGLFFNTYLLELRRTIEHHWHDKRLFDTPEIELSAIEAATTRCCNRLGLSYSESFLLSASCHCRPAHVRAVFSLFSQPDGQNAR